MTFSVHRYMMLHNGMCIGVTFLENKVLYMILSATGEYIHVTYGDDVNIHMTRYIPSRLRVAVLDLLRFRNMFINNALLSNGTNTSIYCTPETHGTATTALASTTWSSTSLRMIHGWTTISDITNSYSLQLSPHQQVLLYHAPICYRDINPSKDTSSDPNTYLASITTAYSYDTAPSALKEHFSAIVSSADTFTSPLLSLPIDHCTAATSKPPINEFKAIAPELYLCRNSSYYVTSYRTVIENIDDIIYASTNTRTSLSVEAWVDCPYINSPSSNFSLVRLQQDILTCYSSMASSGHTYHISLLSDPTTSTTIEELAMHRSSYLHLVELYSHIQQRPVPLSTPSIAPTARKYTPLCRDRDGARFNFLANGVTRACFANRLLLEYCPLTQNVRALLPDGAEISLPVEYYYNLILTQTSTSSSISAMSMQDVAQHVMQLMSFYRYATGVQASHGFNESAREKTSMLVKLSDMRSDYYLQSCNKSKIRTPTTPATSGSATEPNISPEDRRIRRETTVHLNKLNLLAAI